MNLTKLRGTEDEWICLCGNTALGDGFYPCNSKGEMVEPTEEEWTTGCYVCDSCGRIIRQRDRVIVGQRKGNIVPV